MELYRSLLTNQQLEECHQLLTELLESRKENVSSTELTHREVADMYNSRGHIKYLWVDFNGASQDYTEAIRYDPSLAVAYYNRGQIHYRMGTFSLDCPD